MYPRVRRFLDTHKREDREAIRKLGKHTHFPVSSCRENVNAKKSVYIICIICICIEWLIYSSKWTSKRVDFLETNTKKLASKRISIVDYSSNWIINWIDACGQAIRVTLATLWHLWLEPQRNENFNLLEILLKHF